VQSGWRRRNPSSGEDIDGFIVELIAKRRHNLPTRLISAAAIGLMNSGAISGRLIVGWFLAYLFTQLLEGPLFAAILRWRRGSPRLRKVCALAILGVTTFMFASLALPLWLGANWMGPAVAILMLVGAMGNAAAVGREMRPVFLVCFVPHVVLLVFGPFVATAGSHMMPQPALCVGPLIISLNILSGYLAAEKLREAERTSRAELEQKRAEAVAATEAKTNFVAAVSHDLRTPLTAILACAGAIERDARSEGDASRATMIADAAKMMRCLLDDLLDLSKIEAGRMSVEVTTFDPRLLFDDVARFWSEEAARKGLTLTVSGIDSLPPLAGGDTTRIRQILNNLLSNAVKFTPSGGVMIEATAAPTPKGGYTLTACIVDTGVGLSGDQMARLFERFNQTDTSVARTHGGTGLGLAISRELARLMGGDITVQSRLGEGARFTLACALAEPGEDIQVQDRCIHAPADAADLRILVVDDHELNRRALTLLLEPLGVVPSLASSGEEALALLSQYAFDVVLMDLNMAGLDGRETTIRIRAGEDSNRIIPVIAVTGAVEPQVLQSCLDAGMNAWVEKPIEPAALYGAIEQVLRLADNEDQAQAA
jgi:signal transduction histidine kinase/ActR/RegA family two-component response regulator